jgi:hypothetical protein
MVPAVADGHLSQRDDGGPAPGLMLQIADVVLRRPPVHGMEQHVRGDMILFLNVSPLTFNGLNKFGYCLVIHPITLSTAYGIASAAFYLSK